MAIPMVVMSIVVCRISAAQPVQRIDTENRKPAENASVVGNIELGWSAEVGERMLQHSMFERCELNAFYF